MSLLNEGEDVLEFHGHGNPILVRAVVNYFIQQGCQHAPPGAFTQRAFLNEKLDLLQVLVMIQLQLLEQVLLPK